MTHSRPVDASRFKVVEERPFKRSYCYYIPPVGSVEVTSVDRTYKLKERTLEFPVNECLVSFIYHDGYPDSQYVEEVVGNYSQHEHIVNNIDMYVKEILENHDS